MGRKGRAPRPVWDPDVPLTPECLAVWVEVLAQLSERLRRWGDLLAEAVVSPGHRHAAVEELAAGLTYAEGLMTCLGRAEGYAVRGGWTPVKTVNIDPGEGK